MKKTRSVALIVSGNVTKSAVLRLPSLQHELGPVKATTMRLARRITNFLRVGSPVANYEDLGEVSLILVKIPDYDVDRVSKELASSKLDLSNKAIVLCESWLTSKDLKRLTEKGVSVATLSAVEGSKRNWFVIEGHHTAVRKCRSAIEQNETRVLELKQGTKHFYFAAELLAGALPMPLYLAAQQALRATGLSPNHLYAILDEIAQSMFRDFVKGARATWGGPLTECSPAITERHFNLLKAGNPELAALLFEQLSYSRKMLARQKNATKKLEADPS